jgi:hypothetical protein
LPDHHGDGDRAGLAIDCSIVDNQRRPAERPCAPMAAMDNAVHGFGGAPARCGKQHAGCVDLLAAAPGRPADRKPACACIGKFPGVQR